MQKVTTVYPVINTMKGTTADCYYNFRYKSIIYFFVHRRFSDEDKSNISCATVYMKVKATSVKHSHIYATVT